MLSETYHPVSDAGDQVVLLAGIRYGGPGPDGRHPFGHRKVQSLYGFPVSVLFSGVAGWESAKHGYHEVR